MSGLHKGMLFLLVVLLPDFLAAQVLMWQVGRPLPEPRLSRPVAPLDSDHWCATGPALSQYTKRLAEWREARAENLMAETTVRQANNVRYENRVGPGDLDLSPRHTLIECRS